MYIDTRVESSDKLIYQQAMTYAESIYNLLLGGITAKSIALNFSSRQGTQ
jgi:hypothetical protein